MIICPACTKPIVKTLALTGLAKKVNGQWYHTHCLDFAGRKMFNDRFGDIQSNPYVAYDPETLTPSMIGKLKRMSGKRRGKL